jgi:hypothetical protein
VVKDDDLVIATHGRSMYVLANISVLRQLTPAVSQSEMFLFDPADVMRSVNPGATIDFYLKQPAEKVTLDILDARGNIVRTFATAETRKPQEQAGGAAEEGARGAGQSHINARAGMNRITWDMRYPDAAGFPGMILWAASLRGPIAPPGAYQVRLTAASGVQSRSFAVTRNPKLTQITDADLQEQFKLSLQIRDRLSRANEAVVRMRALKEQIGERLGKLDKSKDAAVIAGGEALRQRLTDIEGEIYQYRNQSSQDPLNYPIKLNNKLAALAGIVGSADAAPTDQSYQLHEELTSKINAQLKQLKSTLDIDLAAFNKAVRDKNLAAVK